MRESRTEIEFNVEPVTVQYGELSEDRRYAFEVARFWRAEGHDVNVSRIGDGGVLVMIWAEGRGSWILRIRVQGSR